MIKTIFLIWFLIIFMAFTQAYFAESTLSGKDIFSKVKGPYGTCNTCHPGGSSAGRWDSEAKEISDDGDKKIPEIKGIGKKKSPEQLEKIIVLMRNKYKVPIQDDQMKMLIDYISNL
ncbi:MAG: hypothetical protein HY094_01560 [Candidatus Melainabacteria bacterium]|nr:hypothetical protein [Candidatus Melainabacteria bacterium]